MFTESLVAALLLSSSCVQAVTISQRRDVSGYESTSLSSLERRATASGWTNLGCYSDDWSRTLNGSFAQNNQVTVEWCQATCAAAGYLYAGLENVYQCFCGNTIQGSGQSISNSNCNRPCIANSAQMCGGAWAMNLYSATYTTSSGRYTYSPLGCYTDYANARVLASVAITSNSVTSDWCADYCGSSGYSFAGTESGNQCFCSNKIAGWPGALACTTPCTADSTKICGGSMAISIFSVVPLASNLVTVGGSQTGSFNGGTYSGGACMLDSANRILAGAFNGNAASPPVCASYCAGQGFSMFGVENGNQCFCGNSIPANTPSSNNCYQKCVLDGTQTCGGPWAVNVYNIQKSTSQSGSFAGGTYSGGTCMLDNANRILSGPTSNNAPSPSLCAAYCSGQGYSMFGMEAGFQCFCGNSVASNTPTATNCNQVCNGDNTKICGGQWAMSIFTITKNAPSTTSTSSTATPTPTPTPSPTSGNSPGVLSSNAPATVVTTSVAPASAPSKALFAHYIVGNTWQYTQSMWQTEMLEAQSAGIDAFALNLGSGSYWLSQITNAFNAAQSIGWKAFLSLDVTSLSCQTTADAQNLANIIVNTYKSYPSTSVTYVNPSGQNTVLTSVFGGNFCSLNGGTPNAFWTQVRALVTAANLTVTFAPSMFVDPSQFAAGGNESWADIPFNWDSGWPMGAAPLDTSSDYEWISASGNKPYMAAISPCFFTYYGPNSWNKDWIYRSDDWLIANRLEMLIGMRDKVQFAEIVSWNDYGESHYIGTIGPNQPNSQGWVNGMPHTGWLSLIKWYSSAWKTGTYSAPYDGLWLWSRPHPKGATASAPTNPKPDNWQYTDDNLYVIALLAQPAQVKIYSGLNYAVANLPAGLNKMSVASTAGSIGAYITRNGAVVKGWDSTGVFNYVLTPKDYNFNYFVQSV